MDNFSLVKVSVDKVRIPTPINNVAGKKLAEEKWQLTCISVSRDGSEQHTKMSMHDDMVSVGEALKCYS